MSYGKAADKENLCKEFCHLLGCLDLQKYMQVPHKRTVEKFKKGQQQHEIKKRTEVCMITAEKLCKKKQHGI